MVVSARFRSSLDTRARHRVRARGQRRRRVLAQHSWRCRALQATPAERTGVSRKRNMPKDSMKLNTTRPGTINRELAVLNHLLHKAVKWRCIRCVACRFCASGARTSISRAARSLSRRQRRGRDACRSPTGWRNSSPPMSTPCPAASRGCSLIRVGKRPHDGCTQDV